MRLLPWSVLVRLFVGCAGRLRYRRSMTHSSGLLCTLASVKSEGDMLSATEPRRTVARHLPRHHAYCIAVGVSVLGDRRRRRAADADDDLLFPSARSPSHGRPPSGGVAHGCAVVSDRSWRQDRMGSRPRQIIGSVSSDRSPAELAREFGCTAQTIANWVARSAIDRGKPLPGKDGFGSESILRSTTARVRLALLARIDMHTGLR